MPNRILKDSICTSPNIDQLGRDAEVFFYRLIVHCDDFGRMDARLPILRAKCYPLQIGTVSEDDIASWLDELEAAKLVTVYTVEDQDYLQMRTWDKHQQIRAKRSKYPSLQDSDSNGNHLIADDSNCPRNPIQSNPNPIVTPADDDDFRSVLIGQYSAVMGMFPTASYPEAIGYMDRLQKGNVLDWWQLAITETVDKAKRPSWQYMKSILESWLAAGHPSTASKNGTDPAKGKPATGMHRQASPDGSEWIYTDITTGKVARREPRETEELF